MLLCILENETKIMFVYAFGDFLTLSLCLGPCLRVPPTGIAEILDPKGLRKGMNSQDTQKDSLTQEGNDNTHDQKAGDQLAKFYFSQQALYKRGRDLNIKSTLI
jgi:hypothetical protein